MKTLIISGKEYNRIKMIGKGLFSWVYSLDDGQVLILEKTAKNKQNDWSKIVYSELPTMPHLPEVVSIGSIFYCGLWCNAYTAPMYQSLRGKDCQAKEDYKQIRKIAQYTHDAIFNTWQDNYNSINFLNWIYYFLSECQAKLSEKLADAVEAIVNGFGNWHIDDCSLDIKLNNFAIDDNGNLILLDIMLNRFAMRDWL